MTQGNGEGGTFTSGTGLCYKMPVGITTYSVSYSGPYQNDRLRIVRPCRLDLGLLGLIHS